MSAHKDIRVKLDLSNIDEKEEVDRLEHALTNMEGVTLHELGLSRIELSYDQHAVDAADIERAVENAGGSVRATHRVE